MISGEGGENLAKEKKKKKKKKKKGEGDWSRLRAFTKQMA